MALSSAQLTVSPRPARIIAPLVFAGLTYAVAQTTIVPVVPQIQAATGADASSVAWVITGFFVSSAALTVLSGRLGDLLGKKPVLIAIFLLFGLGAVVSATGASLEMVIAGRVIMGCAGGVFPLSFAILGQSLSRNQAAFGMGLISSTFGLGGALGLPVGGLIADQLGYQGLFWATAVMTLISLVGIVVFVPGGEQRAAGRVDWAGAILLGVTLGGPLTAISRGEAWGWTAPQTLVLLAAGALSLVLLLVVESRVRDPLIDLALMRRRNMWVANLTAFFITVGQAAAFFLIPQIVQLPVESGVGLGIGVAHAGLFMLPAALATMLAGPVTGRAVARFGVRPPLFIGTVGSVAGLLVIGLGGADPAAILVGAALLGLAGGTAYAVLPVLIAESVPLQNLGAANGVNTIVRHISMAISAQLAAAVLVIGTPQGELYPTSGAFLVDFGGSAALGLVALLLIPLIHVGARAMAPEPVYAEAGR
ncbi:MFS transporter [Nocardiopsis ansamitocini]|uniref:MFS transporter n=1 Tax=Nocardiopsis ansamitocini TaxID=1670832 RepID=A0A9W6P647_9ACTN|nr:MFS transporter [Nocardiopsis ansamitocini]GLU47708.1 MFS transporter [Nocardiopsis ansamitocini]